MTTTLLTSFTRWLGSTCDARGFAFERWAQASPASANLLAVGSRPNETLLYVKCRTDPPGFWGLTANRISELSASGRAWYAVFIVGSPETGYLASQDEVHSRTSSGTWKLAGDGDFKIGENRDLGGISRFCSAEQFLELALPSLRRRAGNPKIPQPPT